MGVKKEILRGETMQYDHIGLPIAEDGKNRRPNMPKFVVCQKCKNETQKISYGTYVCEKCSLAYQFKFGKLIRGDYRWYTKVYTDRYGCTREKKYRVPSFMIENGEYVDTPISNI